MGAFLGIFLIVAATSSIFIFVISQYISSNKGDSIHVDPLPAGVKPNGGQAKKKR